MATSAPSVSIPSSARTRDWSRTGEPGSAFSGLGRGRGGGRGRGRGGRGRGGGGGGGGANSTPRTPSAASGKPAADNVSAKPTPSVPAPTHKNSVSSGLGQSTSTTSGSTSNSTQKPSGSSDNAQKSTSTRSKNHGRKASRSAVPTVVVGPSTPSTTDAPSVTARPPNRRRRSQQLPKGNGNGNPAPLMVHVPSLDDNLLRPQNRLAVPHTAPLPSKDTPPHLAGSTFEMRNNIDALVERVRAVAMDNRPSTPGSHIDWAGDDDEGLPDLDDWGVTTSVADDKSVAGKDEMISPIIVDGLKTLPEPVAKPPTPSGGSNEEVVTPFAMGGPQTATKSTQPPPLHPSLPSKPVEAPNTSGGGNSRQPPAPLASAAQASAPAAATSEPVQTLGENVKPARPEGKADDASSDTGREGLAASIHAPSQSDSFVPSNSSTPPPPRRFAHTHTRAHTVGRIQPQITPVNFNSRLSRSGTSTPRGGYAAGNQHARTQSSPPAASVLNNHRTPHSRPVITGDAISRLARTIAVSTPRTPPISASNI
ncbi:hypothetical protein R3P38DRAFT_2830100 [Favolaschia claudopus]|uniref:Uncharacterized protein n=1 Tax=Favolaschia claudopus TaxID=2862362 RepID=A0AAW0EB82_9AGAR